MGHVLWHDGLLRNTLGGRMKIMDAVNRRLVRKEELHRFEESNTITRDFHKPSPQTDNR